MGLDGLSIKNLALNRDNTSKENSINSETLANTRSLDSKDINQLDRKQALTSEDHDNPSFSGGSTGEEDEIEDSYESAEGNENDEEQEDDFEDYLFKIDEEKNIIRVFDRSSKKQVLEITPEDLSKFLSKMKQSSGIIVNRKA